MGFKGSEKLLQFKQIVEGWSNYVFENKEIEELAKLRLDVCLSCTHLNNHKLRCKLCGCYMAAKTRSKNAKCPVKKW